jgi:chromosome segregation ATPase
MKEKETNQKSKTKNPRTSKVNTVNTVKHMKGGLGSTIEKVVPTINNSIRVVGAQYNGKTPTGQPQSPSNDCTTQDKTIAALTGELATEKQTKDATIASLKGELATLQAAEKKTQQAQQEKDAAAIAALEAQLEALTQEKQRNAAKTAALEARLGKCGEQEAH